MYSEQVLIDEVLKKATFDKSRTKLNRIVECELIIDPMQMVSLYNWLGKKIEQYEHLYAKIPTESDVRDKINNMPKELDQG